MPEGPEAEQVCGSLGVGEGAMRRVVGVLVGLSVFTSCATTYLAHYDIALTSAERPADAKERYGEYVIVASSAEDTTRYRYEDELVRISWLPTPYELAFVLENKTAHSIKIVWDEAVFTDQTGVSHRVMHLGTKIADRFSSQPPTVVPRKGMISDLIYPAGYYDMVGYDWRRRDLLPVRRSISKDGGKVDGKIRTHSAMVADFESLVMNAIGKTWEVLLPLQIEDVVNAYLFVFTVKDVQIEAL